MTRLLAARTASIRPMELIRLLPPTRNDDHTDKSGRLFIAWGTVIAFLALGLNLAMQLVMCINDVTYTQLSLHTTR